MAKGYNSVIGIDLGYSSLKAVHLQRKGGGKIALSGYSIRPFSTIPANPDALLGHLRELLKDTGGSAKAYSIASSTREGMVRIIEQPITPSELLREAVRLNSTSLLNQDCRDWILDCDLVKAPEVVEGRPPSRTAQYLVAGMKKDAVVGVTDLLGKAKIKAETLQLAPLATFNAFEVANPEVFETSAFMIVDVGYQETTVIVGTRRELVLVRNIDFGGKSFIDGLTQDGAIDINAAILLVEQSDPGMAEVSRVALAPLAREIRSSIGFFEGQREESIAKVFISGAMARAEMPLQIISNELDLPCELWDPTAKCDIALSKNKRGRLTVEFVSLNVAFGAAWELLHKEV